MGALTLSLLCACTELAPGDERIDTGPGPVDVGADTFDAGTDAADASEPDACADPPIGDCPPLCLRDRRVAGLAVSGVGHSVGADQTWSCDTIWVLEDDTYVENSTLTIEAGTLVEAMPGASLVVRDGSELVVRGSAQAPVVIRPPVPADVGDEWRGLYLLGDAPVLNSSGGRTTNSINRLNETRSEHGGDDAEHNCGSIEYLRLEFGGITREATEAESLFIGGCGTQTTLDYIQVHQSSDDAIVIHGGGFDLRHIVVTSTDQDAVQWERGWNGTLQYYIAHLPPGTTQSVLQAEGPIAGDDPPSNGLVANMTTVATGTERAVIVEGSTLFVGNSIAVQPEDFLTVRSAHRSRWGLDAVELRNSILFSPPPFFDQGGLEALYAPPSNGNSDLDPSLPASATNPVLRLPDWRPAMDSTAATVSGELPEGLDATDYAGAVDPDPAVADWTEGWTSYPSI